ncbi:hypothetical protein FRZ61_18800 [Hypericibacter adhaerens]|uniref:Uncharacterized protein n=1 Tax=Hypericibacter adhaerens TaxID=2602016 RepID=A0A5J6MXC2_9PROT|nr:hypothetical protein FRZ61_18800 [Hypericibacter adhaerens]
MPPLSVAAAVTASWREIWLEENAERSSGRTRLCSGTKRVGLEAATGEDPAVAPDGVAAWASDAPTSAEVSRAIGKVKILFIAGLHGWMGVGRAEGGP